MRKIFQGNVEELGKETKGWFFGHFMKEGTPFKTDDFEVKWGKQQKGDMDKVAASNKTAKTLAVLVRGEFLFRFPGKEILLEKEGDFVFYDAGVAHAWEVPEDCLLLSIRWPSKLGDQVKSSLEQR